MEQVVKQSKKSRGLEAPAQVGATAHLDLAIGGMTCPHCPPAVEKALKAVASVTAAQVNLVNRVARVDYDPARASATDLVRAIRSAGYVAGTARVRIPIKHMHCTSCVTRIEFALQMTPGVVSARASLGPNAVDVEYQPDVVGFGSTTL